MISPLIKFINNNFLIIYNNNNVFVLQTREEGKLFGGHDELIKRKLIKVNYFIFILIFMHEKVYMKLYTCQVIKQNIIKVIFIPNHFNLSLFLSS